MPGKWLNGRDKDSGIPLWLLVGVPCNSYRDISVMATHITATKRNPAGKRFLVIATSSTCMPRRVGTFPETEMPLHNKNIVQQS